MFGSSLIGGGCDICFYVFGKGVCGTVGEWRLYVIVLPLSASDAYICCHVE